MSVFCLLWRLGVKREGVVIKMKPVFRINAHCPYCKEEHLWLNILLSDEEQQKYDEFYAAHPYHSTFEDIFQDPPPLTIVKRIHCGVCGKIFSQKFNIFKSIEITNMHGIGEVPI